MKRFLYLSIFIFVVFASQTFGATRTVCSSGCTGTTLQSVYNGASCGDTIELRFSSTVTDNCNGLTLNKQCTSSAPITIKNGSGFTPALSQTCSSWVSSMEIAGNYHIIDSINFANTYHGNGIWITGNNNTIQNCTVDKVYSQSIGDGASGEAILISGNSNIIQNNTILDSNHGGIELYYVGTAKNIRYNQILNNTIKNRYGHCLGLTSLEVQYNLFDGNKLQYCGSALCTGGSCDAKNAIQLSGSQYNSFRRNVIYDIYNRGIELSSYTYGGYTNEHPENNWFYNNTFYNITTRSSHTGNTAWVEAASGVSGGTIANNKFYNNIVDKVGQQVIDEWHSPAYQGVFVLGYVQGATDAGDNLPQVIASDFNGNVLKNNSIRVYHGGAYDLNYQAAFYYCNNGSAYQPIWSVTGLNNVGSHSGNITTDCRMASTDTSVSEWWFIQSTSPCKDAGVVVNDPNAVTGGWKQLDYRGLAPDIGANENFGIYIR